jgi:hypothetical protein
VNRLTPSEIEALRADKRRAVAEARARWEKAASSHPNRLTLAEIEALRQSAKDAAADLDHLADQRRAASAKPKS